MNVTRNAVYNYVCNALTTAYSSLYVASVYEPIPAHLPAVFIREIGDFRNKENMTITGHQGIRTSTFEVQVVVGKANGSMTECYGILETARYAFFELLYNETSVVIVEDGQDGSYRLRASYRRVIGDNDVMPSGS